MAIGIKHIHMQSIIVMSHECDADARALMPDHICLLTAGNLL